MGYGDDDAAAPAGVEAGPSIAAFALGAMVRLIGLVVLIVGLWVGVKIILEAWALYEEPARIERFATAIQHGSNIDGVLADLGAGDETAARAARAERASGGGGSGVRLSYFAAWLIVLLLMFVVGSLAMAAITTGGQLVLYDLQVKRHSGAVIKEIRRTRRAA